MNEKRIDRANALFDGIHGLSKAECQAKCTGSVDGYTPGLAWRASDTVKQRMSKAVVLNNRITIEEVVIGIEKMNRRAAPGVDGIPTQCIKEAWKGDDKEDPMCHILAPHLTK